LVDPKLVDLSKIDQETRYRIFMYLWKKRVGSRELGIHPTYANRIKNRKVPVSDTVLERLLEYLTAEELAELTGVYVLEKVEPHTLIQVVKAGLADPQLRNLVINMVMRYVDLGEYERKYRVTEEDIKKFEEYLRKNRRKKTVQDRLYYLKVALKDNQFVLDASKLDDYIMEKAEESIDKAIHIARALKLFLKVVVRVKEPRKFLILYNSFTTPSKRRQLIPKALKILHDKEEPLSLEDIKTVARHIENPAAKLAFILLAETGLRPGEIFNLSLRDIDLETRAVIPAKITESKRAYISFFSEATANYIKNQYLEWRKHYIEENLDRIRNLARQWTPKDKTVTVDELVEDWEEKLIPIKESKIRSMINEAMAKAGIMFRLYDLRSFFTSWMIQHGAQEIWINIFQGRAPPKQFEVMVNHYLQPVLEKRGTWKQALIQIRERFYEPYAYNVLSTN